MSELNNNNGFKITLAVSGCLLGQKIRYDTSSKKLSLFDTWNQLGVEFTSFCPEMQAGMGTPREAIRLQRDAEDRLRVITSRSGQDLTDDLQKSSREILAQKNWSEISGVVLKSNSPSCGLYRVKLYDKNGIPSKSATGVFAENLLEKYPLIPVEEEGRLNDLEIRENFMEAIYARARLTQLLSSKPKPRDLILFHAKYKYSLMARSPKYLKELGHIVASCRVENISLSLISYEEIFMKAFKMQAQRKSHLNVLLHLVGYFKKMPKIQTKLVHEAINGFSNGFLPLTVPLKLISFLAKTTESNYLTQQYYLEPFPLGLRSIKL